jgi:RNA polymerase sigma-70 factor (ECF subfamily)
MVPRHPAARFLFPKILDRSTIHAHSGGDAMTQPNRDARGLLAEARAGSGESLGLALESCRGYLLAIAEGELPAELRAKGSASDLVQQTFLEAQRDLPRFHGETEEEWRAWLRRLLLNNVANFTRDYGRTAKRQATREVALEADGASGVGIDPMAASLSPSAEVVAREQSAALEAALTRLPADYAEVLRLRQQERLSFADIGIRMGRSDRAARMLWVRAVERLRQEMEAR